MRHALHCGSWPGFLDQRFPEDVGATRWKGHGFQSQIFGQGSTPKSQTAWRGARCEKNPWEPMIRQPPAASGGLEAALRPWMVGTVVWFAQIPYSPAYFGSDFCIFLLTKQISFLKHKKADRYLGQAEPPQNQNGSVSHDILHIQRAGFTAPVAAAGSSLTVSCSDHYCGYIAICNSYNGPIFYPSRKYGTTWNPAQQDISDSTSSRAKHIQGFIITASWENHEQNSNQQKFILSPTVVFFFCWMFGWIFVGWLDPFPGEDGITACTGVIASVAPHQNRLPQESRPKSKWDLMKKNVKNIAKIYKNILSTYKHLNFKMFQAFFFVSTGPNELKHSVTVVPFRN